MNFRLKIEQKRFLNDGSGRRLFSFAVVDLDRSKSYPQNFVCMLPTHLGTGGKVKSVFEKFFGDESVEQAKRLLAAALKNEDDSQIKKEIEKRLKLLEPKPVTSIECKRCGKLFSPGRVKRHSRKFCLECLAKIYGN